MSTATCRDELGQVPGVPQTRLSPDQLAILPDRAAPAPWRATASAIMWWQPPSRAIAEVLDRRLGAIGPPLGLIGSLVRYSDTPVGGYDEVFATVLYVTRRGPRATTPFIAVSSAASVVGGRANWAMPKTLAAFDGSPSQRHMSATAGSWTVSARARALGPTVPLRAAGRIAQVWPDGHVRHAIIGGAMRGRAALIQLRVDSDATLAGWLRPGRCPGLVVERLDGHLGIAA